MMAQVKAVFSFFVIFRVAIGYARLHSTSIETFKVVERPSFAVIQTNKMASGEALSRQCFFLLYERKTPL